VKIDFDDEILDACVVAWQGEVRSGGNRPKEGAK
jgi:hypothetical protein